MKQFKPQLLPNNKAGVIINWKERIKHPIEWLYSKKIDGARIELFWDGTVKGRSLKPIPSLHIQQMGEDILASIPTFLEGSIIEAEFYSPEMNFAEVMHFFRCADVTSDKEISKLTKLWSITVQGTFARSKGVWCPIETLNTQELRDATKWEFPGRSVEWLTTWHKSLKFYAFDLVNINTPDCPKAIRTLALDKRISEHIQGYASLEPDMLMIKQNPFTHINELYEAYKEAIAENCEGLVIMHKGSNYKFGRYTLNSKQAFKFKDDNQEFDGLIVGVE